jgi:hypothetical protein
MSVAVTTGFVSEAASKRVSGETSAALALKFVFPIASIARVSPLRAIAYDAAE